MTNRTRPERIGEKKNSKRNGGSSAVIDDREKRMELRRANLLKRRNEILREAKEQLSKSIGGDIRQLVETALDEGDLAEINVQEDINLRRLSTYRDTLHDIDEVLRRMKEGSYGICEACGGEISESRLDVMPSSRYCVSCQELKEQLEKAGQVEENTM